MSLRITSLIWMACFAVGAFGVYMVKFAVQNLHRDVVTTQQQLAAEKESLHLLNAEWAYLNRPDRLQKLASEHLVLVPLDSRRIENVALLPDAQPQAPHSPVSEAVYR